MTSRQQRVVRDIAKKVIDDQLVWIAEQVDKDIEYLRQLREAIEEQESSEIEITAIFNNE
tara:strand:- start:1804 stop:1983 length:180 start_codon:yes stop_codon:yes gene_type:complete